MTREEEIEILEAKARARRGLAGYEKNVAEIEARIAKLRAEGGRNGG